LQLSVAGSVGSRVIKQLQNTSTPDNSQKSYNLPEDPPKSQKTFQFPSQHSPKFHFIKFATQALPKRSILDISKQKNYDIN
jgi:hypothetical protein